MFALERQRNYKTTDTGFVFVNKMHVVSNKPFPNWFLLVQMK